MHLRFPSLTLSALPARLRTTAPVALVAATVMTLATGAGAATVRHGAASPNTHKSLAASKHGTCVRNARPMVSYSVVLTTSWKPSDVAGSTSARVWTARPKPLRKVLV